MRRELVAGERFASFVIEGVLGRGGMGVVYRARRETGLSDRVVALKVIRPELATDDRFLARFRDEARRAASLEHPSIVPVYEADEHDGVPFIAMRLIQGRDLHALVQARGPLPPATVVRIAEQLASALDAAHADGLVHRDVKPQNVLLDEAGRAYLTDFGLVRMVDATGGHTATGSVVGTLAYMAPEQSYPDRSIDGRADQYALACTLYEAACGRPPFAGESDVQLVLAHRLEPPPSLASLSRSASVLDAPLARALAKEPADRYASCGELAAQLTNAVGSDPAAAAQPAPRSPPSRRRFALAAAAAVAVAAVLAVGVVLLAMQDDDDSVVEPNAGESTAGDGSSVAAPGAETLVETVAAAASSSEAPADPPSVLLPATDGVAAFGTGTAAPQQAFSTGVRPTLVAVDGDVLWVANAGDRTVSRIEPASGDVRTIGTAEVPSGLAVGDGAVWVSNGFADQVSRLDPTTGAIVARIPVDGGPTGLAADETGVWVVTAVGGELVRIDPTNNAVTDRIELGGEPIAIGLGHGSVWVANRASETLIRVDPDAGQVVKRIGLTGAPASLAVAEGGVWLSHPEDDAVTFVDAEREAVTRTLDVPGRPYALAAAASGVWVAQSAARALLRLDDGGAAGEPVALERHPLALASAGDGETVWATLGADAAEAVQVDSQLARGGTLRVLAEEVAPGDLDPQWHPAYATAALGRCCLQRTLMSYSGRPAADGGTILRPDLAERDPEVSSDGLTWTFRLRRGLRYAPPYDDVEITAADVVRALERLVGRPPEGVDAATPPSFGAGAPDFATIVGYDDFVEGESDTIAGLETPDDHTLVVRVERASGEVGHLFSLPYSAPQPPGATDGHHADYEGFQVSSGPYMIEGADRDDVSSPPSGFRAGDHLTLVRNPSWSHDVDGLRAAYADRLEIELGPVPTSRDEAVESALEHQRRVEAGELDVLLDRGSTFVDPAVVERYRNDPELRDRMVVSDDDAVEYLAMRLAVPPFDDVHVRRAVNLVLDKAAYLRACCVASVAAGHAIVNSTLDGLIVDYDPYASTGNAGDVRQARAEMALSRYDSDGDGRCDAAACRNVTILYFEGFEVPLPELEKIGIRTRPRFVPPERWEAAVGNPRAKYGLVGPLGFAKSVPTAGNQFAWIFHSRAIFDGSNASLVGATPDQLAAWGHAVRQVPSLDDEIAACSALIGTLQTQCWADATRTLMEDVVPVAPFTAARSARFFSARVANPMTDAVFILPPLDQLALRPDAT